MKLRHFKLRRFTHVTAELYREPVFRVVQDMLGYEEVPEPPVREELEEEFYSNREVYEERFDTASDYVDDAIEQWERIWAHPQPIVSEAYLSPTSYRELRRAGVPPSGETRGAMRKHIAEQHRLRRLRGVYQALRVRSYNNQVLVMLDWVHADILDLEVADPALTQLVQSPHAFLRVAGPWIASGLPGRGRWKLRMGGSDKFFHPAGEGQKIVDRQLRDDSRPQWLRKLQEDAMADVEGT